MKRAAYLGRVSTQNQNKADRHGLAEQRRAAYAYAEKNGFEIIADFEDVISGASESRPKFYELLSRSYEFQAVIVASIDRIAREKEIGFRHLRLIREVGLELYSASDGLVEDGLISGIRVLLSEEARKQIAETTQHALIAEARAGKMPNGMKIFGYLNVPGQNRGVVDPVASTVVRKVFELAGQGLSYRAMAREMMASDVRSPKGSPNWYQHTVRRMVCNPAYKGEFVWTHKDAGRFVIPVPPIVSLETWERAQRHKRGPPVRIPLPLSGRLRCGVCGLAMSIRKAQRAGLPVYLYYRCTSPGTPRGACGAGFARRERTEARAEEELRRVMLDPDVMRDIMTSDQDIGEQDQRRLTALAERAERVAEMRLDGVIDRARASEMMRAVDLSPVAITITGGDTVSRDGQDYRVPKRDLVSVVQVLLQSERLKIASSLKEAQTLTSELLAFRVSISLKGHDSYGNDVGPWRENPHDDLVLAVASATWYGENYRAPPLRRSTSFSFPTM